MDRKLSLSVYMTQFGCCLILVTFMVPWLHLHFIVTTSWLKFNSLVRGRCRCNLKLIIFKLMSRVDILSISCEIALRGMPRDFTDDKSTLVQVLAWCRQATSHYLGQCWPRYILPYGVARPQWVKLYSHMGHNDENYVLFMFDARLIYVSLIRSWIYEH